jgi:transposase
MAKKQDTKLHFITLRANGSSYDEIAKELNISKHTAIQWATIYQSEIDQIKYESFIQVKESFKRSKLKRYETLLSQLEKIDNALMNEETLSRANPKDLMQLKITLEQQIAKIEHNTTFETQYTQKNILGDEETIKATLVNE